MWRANALPPKEKADQWPTPRLRKARGERWPLGSRPGVEGYMTSYYLSLFLSSLCHIFLFLSVLDMASPNSNPYCRVCFHSKYGISTTCRCTSQLVGAALGRWFNSSTWCDVNFAWCSCCRSFPCVNGGGPTPLKATHELSVLCMESGCTGCNITPWVDVGRIELIYSYGWGTMITQQASEWSTSEVDSYSTWPTVGLFWSFMAVSISDHRHGSMQRHALTPTLPDKSTSKDMIGECTPTYSTARNVKAARQQNLVA